MNEVTASAAAHPTRTPIPVAIATCLLTTEKIDERLAPSAMRIPISERRWLTMYETTP
jgi:hypothetical protein